jgi:hypothetical protein
MNNKLRRLSEEIYQIVDQADCYLDAIEELEDYLRTSTFETILIADKID